VRVLFPGIALPQTGGDASTRVPEMARAGKPRFEQAMGYVTEWPLGKTKQRHVLLRVRDLRECFSGKQLDCLVLATEPSLLPSFLASLKNSSAFHENGLRYPRAPRSTTPALNSGEHPWSAQLKSQRRFHPMN
jgi:hypothetical protein